MFRPSACRAPSRGLRPRAYGLLLLVGLCSGVSGCGHSDGTPEGTEGVARSATEEVGSTVWRVDWPARQKAGGFVVEAWAGRRMVFRRSVPDTFALLEPVEIRAIEALGGVDSVEIQVRPRGDAVSGPPDLREPWRGRVRVSR